MNVMKVYTSPDYLSEPDLDDKRVKVQIASVEIVTGLRAKPGKQSKPRAVLTLKSARGDTIAKKLILNPTNAKVIAAAHGKKDDNWIGKWIELFPDKCEAFGKQNTPCIRLTTCDAPAPAPKPESATTTTPAQ